MARHSRVAHPAGSRFLTVHYWVLDAAPCGEKLGVAGAMVLDVLCFWDRLQEEEHCWLGKSRMDLRDHLEGCKGKDVVKAALDRLIKIGWVEEKQVTTGRVGGGWDTRSDLRLMSANINKWLAKNNSLKSEESHFESKHSDFPQSGTAESSHHARRFSAAPDGDFQPGYIDKEGVVLNKTTNKTTTTLDVSDLKKLPDSTVDEILKIVSGHENAQRIIYQLAASLAAKRDIRHPVRWVEKIMNSPRPDFCFADQFAMRKQNAITARTAGTSSSQSQQPRLRREPSAIADETMKALRSTYGRKTL